MNTNKSDTPPVAGIYLMAEAIDCAMYDYVLPPIYNIRGDESEWTQIYNEDIGAFHGALCKDLRSRYSASYGLHHYGRRGREFTSLAAMIKPVDEDSTRLIMRVIVRNEVFDNEVGDVASGTILLTRVLKELCDTHSIGEYELAVPAEVSHIFADLIDLRDRNLSGQLHDHRPRRHSLD